MATDFVKPSERIKSLSAGAHNPDGQACALEYLSVARGIDWTDAPEKVRCFDLRLINDISVSDALRTEHLMPVLMAYDGSLDWPMERQQRVVERIIILTVQRLVADLPGLPDTIREQCRKATTLTEAAEAARAAAGAAWAASWAAWAASWAAWAAIASQEKVFIVACQVWLDAVKE